MSVCEIVWFKVRRRFQPLGNLLNCWMTTKINICGCHVMGTCGKNCRQSSHVSYAMHPGHLTTASEQGGHFSSFTHFYDSFPVWVTAWCWWFSEQCMRKVKKDHKSHAWHYLSQLAPDAQRWWPSWPRLCANNPSDHGMPSISINNPPPLIYSVWRAIPTEMQTSLSSAFYGQAYQGGLHSRC